jgi:hypothetical protein
MLAACLGAASPLRCPGTDQIAFHVGQPAKHGNHQSPGAGGGVGPRLGQRPELSPRVHNTFDDGEQVEGRAGQAIDPRHRHHVARGQPLQKPEQLPPIGLRPARLLAVDPGASVGPQLLKLRIERLAIGADAGIAKAAGLPWSFGHILR